MNSVPTRQLEEYALSNPIMAMHMLETNTNVVLAILCSDMPPTSCASPVDDVLKFLGTSADEVLSADRTTFGIETLQIYMKRDEHFAVDAQGRITHVSRRGMHRIAKDLATPESNVVHASLCGATFVLFNALAH